jgi:hypothetical protein
MIESMKQALEALENTLGFTGSRQIDSVTRQAITSLRQAIAEAKKQEPHSWYSVQHDEWMTEKTRKEHERLNSYTHKVGGFDLALYTHPQPKREWVGLTVMEAIELDIATNHPREFAAAIEAKLKEKNFE